MQEIRFDIVQTITIAAIVNGLIFSVLLLQKQENREANRFLSLLLFSMCFSLAAQLGIDLGVYNYYPWLHWLPAKLTFWIGPAFYLYVKTLTGPGFQFRRVHLWHFAWIIFEYPHSVYHLVLGRVNPLPRLHNFTEAMGAYVLFPLMVYAYFSHRLIINYRNALLDQYSSTESRTLAWLKQLILMGAFISFPLLIMFTVDFRIFYDYDMEFFEGTLLQYDYIITLLFVMAIFWLGIGGFRQAQVAIDQDLWSVRHKDVSKDYSPIIEALMKAMQNDKLYLDPELTLRKLAQHTDLAERDLSAALNQQLKKNFYAFVNEFRVEEVKKRLKDPQHEHLKLLSIAFDAGFNSKATFNRIFKEYTGESPKAYREKAS